MNWITRAVEITLWCFLSRFGSKIAAQDGAKGKLRTNPHQLPVPLQLIQVLYRRTGHPINFLSTVSHHTSHPLPVSPMFLQLITCGVSTCTTVPHITSRQKFPPQIQLAVLCSLVLHSASFTGHVRLSPRQRRHPSQRWRSGPVRTRRAKDPPLCATTRTAQKAVTLPTSISLPWVCSACLAGRTKLAYYCPTNRFLKWQQTKRCIFEQEHFRNSYFAAFWRVSKCYEGFSKHFCFRIPVLPT